MSKTTTKSDAFNLEAHTKFERALTKVNEARIMCNSIAQLDNSRTRGALADSISNEKRTGTSHRVRAARALRMAIRTAKRARQRLVAVPTGKTATAKFEFCKAFNKYIPLELVKRHTSEIYNVFSDGSFRRATLKKVKE